MARTNYTVKKKKKSENVNGPVFSGIKPVINMLRRKVETTNEDICE